MGTSVVSSNGMMMMMTMIGTDIMKGTNGGTRKANVWRKMRMNRATGMGTMTTKTTTTRTTMTTTTTGSMKVVTMVTGTMKTGTGVTGTTTCCRNTTTTDPLTSDVQLFPLLLLQL